MLKGALASFLSQGFRANDVTRSPGGFTVFMCAPLGFEQEMTKEQMAQRISETFGEGKLDEGLLKEYSSLKLFLPQTMHEADEQLEVAVSLLDLLTRTKSVASTAYRCARDSLKKNVQASAPSHQRGQVLPHQVPVLGGLHFPKPIR